MYFQGAIMSAYHEATFVSIERFDGVVYVLQEAGRQFKDCTSYYQYLMSMYDPDYPEQARFEDLRTLEALMYPGASYHVDPETVYVDNWAVNEEFILHKHPEFGKQSFWGGPPSYVEVSISSGSCDLCGLPVPGYILFINKLYNL